MSILSIFAGVAGVLISIGALTQLVGISSAILAAVLFIVSVLLLVKAYPGVTGSG